TAAAQDQRLIDYNKPSTECRVDETGARNCTSRWALARRTLQEYAHGNTTSAVFHKGDREFFETRKRSERLARGQGRQHSTRQQSDGNVRRREWRGPQRNPSGRHLTLVS